MDELYLGIDFGNTNLKVSTLSGKQRNPKVVSIRTQHGSGDKVQKNIVFYDKDGKVILGERALIESHKNTVFGIKRKLELEFWEKEIENLGKKKNSREVVADILKLIKEKIESNNGNHKITAAAITVPVTFSEKQKDILRSAAKDINLNLEMIITEPVAAAIEYGALDELEDGDRALIFDFGGGTLDFAIFEYTEDDKDKKIEILNSMGLDFGGNNIDKYIYENIFLKKIDMSVFDADEQESIKKDLMKTISEKKEDIFSDDEDAIEVLLDEGAFYYKHAAVEAVIEIAAIHRWFEETGIRDKIYRILDEMLYEADIEKEEIKYVKMIGGSSRIKYFQELLEEYIENEDIFSAEDDIDEDDLYTAVCNGAVRYLAALKRDEYSLEIEDIIPYDIGIKSENGKFKALVSKNSKYEDYASLKPFPAEGSLTLYQRFKDAEGTDKEVYLSKIKIDMSKYEETAYYKIGTNRYGKITCRIYESGRQNIKEEIFI